MKAEFGLADRKYKQEKGLKKVDEEEEITFVELATQEIIDDIEYVVAADEFAIDIPENVIDPDGLLGRRKHNEVLVTADYLLGEEQLKHMGPKTQLANGKNSRNAKKRQYLMKDASDDEIYNDIF